MFEVTAVCVFQDYAEGLIVSVVETAFVLDDVGNGNRGQESDLVECCVFFLLTDSGKGDGLHGVLLFCVFVPHKEHFSKTTETELSDNVEIGG